MDCNFVFVAYRKSRDFFLNLFEISHHGIWNKLRKFMNYKYGAVNDVKWVNGSQRACLGESTATCMGWEGGWGRGVRGDEVSMLCAACSSMFILVAEARVPAHLTCQTSLHYALHDRLPSRVRHQHANLVTLSTKPRDNMNTGPTSTCDTTSLRHFSHCNITR